MNVLEVDNITMSRGGLTILDQVNLTAEEAKVTSLIGPNGAGKTSLFHVISGFMKPDSGRVRLRGDDISTLLPEQRCARGLARTFQSVRGLPALTVRENLLVGALNVHSSVTAARADADELIGRLALERFADESPAALPIGVKKIVEVARALATKPSLVLLDEVMGGLGATEVRSMTAFVNSLPAEGVTVILIEHHMEAVMGASDHIVVINRGRNLAEGTPAEVRANPAVVEAYLGSDDDELDA